MIRPEDLTANLPHISHVNDPATLHRLGRALLERERRTEAAEFLAKAVSIDPSIPGLLTDQGKLLRDLNDLPGAIRAYEEARRLDPCNVAAIEALLVLQKDDRDRMGMLQDALKRCKSR